MSRPTRIRLLRYEHGLTREDVAREMDVSVRTVGSWERGDVRPSPSNAKQLADRFGVSVSYMLWLDSNGDDMPAKAVA
jgi:transcriptional regulator with XRE-family HTH domain